MVRQITDKPSLFFSDLMMSALTILWQQVSAAIVQGR